MSLADIRAKLMAQDNKSQTNQAKSQGDNTIYPHWDIDEGTSATVRFLPDADSSNGFFWVERAMIKLPFNGVLGQADTKQYIVQVPCMETYGEPCPILAEVRTWYKDESLKETANKYWKKRTYLFQGIVRNSPLQEDKVPENPIRRFVISPQIFNVITNSLKDPEIEEMPTDYGRGLDFKITKGRKGDFADYSTSSFARKETSLTQAELEAIDQFGLFNLREFLPKKPSESEQRIIKEMFEASVDGRPYDPKWAAYYKPWGLNIEGAGSTGSDDEVVTQAPRVVAKPAPQVAESNSAPWEDDAQAAADSIKVPASTDKANDILAMIRSRQNKAA
jgi:hypothetical protein